MPRCGGRALLSLNLTLASPAPLPAAGRVALRAPRRSLAWCAVAAAILIAAGAVILATSLRPSYDAFGWMVWGRQVLHGDLNTDGAPSWKPLTFLFTLPFALFGRGPQLWLWMLTATASALAGAVFAARIAYRLAAPGPGRRWAGVMAGGFAGVGLLGMSGLSQVVMIANADPLIVTLLLAAVDRHLAGRPRQCLCLLALAALGRPEALALAGPYGLWAAWRSPRRWQALVLVGLGLAAIPLAWLVVPAVSSHGGWFGAARFDLNTGTGIHGNKILGVLGRLRSIYELPMQIAVGLALLAAVLRRDRAALTLAAAAALWVVVEIGFALHGFSAVARYLLEPAALLIVIAAGALGRLLAYRPQGPTVLRYAAVVPLVALLAALAPAASSRVRVVRSQIHAARHARAELARLEGVVDLEGGPRRIRSCGQPVTLLGYQSELAWMLHMNVGEVGWRPGRSIGRGERIVLFKPHAGGWQVRLYNQPPADRARCSALRLDAF